MYQIPVCCLTKLRSPTHLDHSNHNLQNTYAHPSHPTWQKKIHDTLPREKQSRFDFMPSEGIEPLSLMYIHTLRYYKWRAPTVVYNSCVLPSRPRSHSILYSAEKTKRQLSGHKCRQKEPNPHLPLVKGTPRDHCKRATNRGL